jgi:ATP:ADP antiporter, AAA family
VEGKDGITSESQRAVWPATIASASLVAQLVAGKATRDALFLTHFDLTLLPAAMIGAAMLSALSVVVMSGVLTRSGPARVVPATFAASALLFLIEWSIALKSEHATAVAVYAHTAIFSSAIGSAFWSLVNERFDPHEAKHLVGRITSGGTIGGIIGGLLVWRASAHLSVPMMLALLAAMSVVGLWGSLRMAPSSQRRRPKAPAIVTRGGLGVLTETPYLRDLALLVGAGAIVQALLDWLLSAHATHQYGQGPSLLGFFAFFNMLVGVLSFAVQTGLTRTILEKRGLGGTIKLQPMSVAASVVALLALSVFWPWVVVLRIVEGVTRGSLYRSAYELFYTPLPKAKKRATKTLIDVGVDRVGTALGSGLLFAIAHLASLDLQTRVVLFSVLGMSAAAWLIAARLQDGYVSALAASLKSGAVALEDDDAEDLTTKRTLAETTALLDRDKLLARIEQFQRQKELRDGKSFGARPPSASPVSERAPLSSTGELGLLFDPRDGVLARAAALRSSDPTAIKLALASPMTPPLAPFAVPLLANDAVVRDVVRSLRKVAPRITGALLDQLLDPDVDPRVRRRIPRILKVCRTQRAATGLLFALRDPAFEVRVQVGIALGQLAEEAAIRLDRDAVFDVVVHELTTGRATWATAPTSVAPSVDPEPPASDVESAQERETRPSKEDAELGGLRRGLGHVFVVLGLVLEREPLSIAYRALRSEDAALRGTAFEYLEVVLPSRVRELVVPLLGDVKPAPRSRERGSKELADELLRSQAGLLRPTSR